MLTKRMEKKPEGNYTRKLRAILNKSWRQHPTKQLLYGHLPLIIRTIKVRLTKHAGHCWRSGDKLINVLWTPQMAKQGQGNRLETTYSTSVRIRDVAQRTSQKQWTIRRSGKRGSWISVLVEQDEMMIFDGYYINKINFLQNKKFPSMKYMALWFGML